MLFKYYNSNRPAEVLSTIITIVKIIATTRLAETAYIVNMLRDRIIIIINSVKQLENE